MKDKILEAFANLGFHLEYAEGIGYLFNYEGMRYLYMYNQEDESFLSISLPGFYDYDDEKTGQFCALAERINSTLKYVKAYTLNGSMWLFYERELINENEDMEEIISRMVRHLENGLLFARKSIDEIEAGLAIQSEAAEASDDESSDNDE